MRIIASMASALLAVAARRWPEELRADLHREWVGELHELAAGGRHWQMLTFAGSLAVTRPRVRPFSVAAAGRATWSGLRLLVVLPVVAVALGLLGACGLLLAVPCALLMAALGGRYAPRRLPVILLIPVMTVPGTALWAAAYALGTGQPSLGRHGMAALVFGAGLTLAVAVAAPLARRCRSQVWAWLAGVAGAFAAADAAVAVIVSADPFYDPSGAPMWLVALLTGSALGRAHPDASEIFVLKDATLADPGVYLVLAGLALGAVIANRLHAPVRAGTATATRRP